jgi:hypothetical protein
LNIQQQQLQLIVQSIPDTADRICYNVSQKSGASMSFDELWQERNAIYARNGYCFKTAKAIAAFGKSCFPPYGALQGPGRNRVAEISIWEKQKACLI